MKQKRVDCPRCGKMAGQLTKRITNVRGQKQNVPYERPDGTRLYVCSFCRGPEFEVPAVDTDGQSIQQYVVRVLAEGMSPDAVALKLQSLLDVHGTVSTVITLDGKVVWSDPL